MTNSERKLTALERSEHDMVMDLGRRIGFGRILQLAPECWDKYLGFEGPGRLHAETALKECRPVVLAELAAVTAERDTLKARVAELEANLAERAEASNA